MDGRISVLTQPDASVLQDIYALYENLFSPDERETLAGLTECLALNARSDLQARFGAFEESWLYARDPATGKITGALNLFLCDFAGTDAAEWFGGAAQINYVFVDPAHRKAGLASTLYQAAKDYAEEKLEKEKVLFLCEQNPKLEESFGFFSRKGFCSLDFPYVQLALHDDALPYHELDLRICAPAGTRFVPAVVVREFLLRFFSISILKGKELDTSAEWRAMKNFLEQAQDISFKEPS